MAFAASVVLAKRMDTGDVVESDLAFVAVLLAATGWLAFWGIRERWVRAAGPAVPEVGGTGPLGLPDDPPVVVEALCGRGVSPAGIGVIVLDLARRGFVTIEEDAGGGYTFRRADTPTGELRPYENAVYTRLFAGGEETTLADLRQWARARRQQAGVFLDRVDKYVENELAASGYVQLPPQQPVVANLAVAAVVGLVGLVALLHGAPAGLLALASAGGQVAAGRALRKRALLGTGRAGEWAEVARGLEQFDSPQAPTPDPAGWDRLLVYAAALGVYRPFVEAALRRHPDLATNDAVAPWFRGNGSGGRRLDGVDRFVRTFGAELRAAAR